MRDYGSWLWLVIDVGFVVLLAAGLIWGSMMWRSRRQRAHTEQATRDLYRRGAQNERHET
jgi:hypothetical protein